MRNTKELESILQAIYQLNYAEIRKNEGYACNNKIHNLLTYALMRVFNANTNFLLMCCATSELTDMENATKQLLERDTKFNKYMEYMENKKMTPYKTQAYISSLNQGKIQPTEMDEITVLEKVGNNDYIVDYKGVKCHALFNWFVCAYFADDLYRVVK